MLNEIKLLKPVTCRYQLSTFISTAQSESTCELTCEQLTFSRHRQCKPTVPYSQAGFPNLLGHKDSSEALRYERLVTDLTLANCYSDTRMFLCELLFPECEEGRGFLLPPKQICVDFMFGCKDNSDFMESDLEFDCDEFPDSESAEPKYNCHESGKFQVLTLKCPSEKSSRGAQGGGRGGVSTFPPLKNIFPVEFMHKNCTIDKGHQTLLIFEEKN